MILYVKGDLFQSPAQVLVNTVNTVGVMGKGIALEFKRLYPEMFVKYQALCEAKQFTVGTLWLYKTQNKWILNFPTKKHWRDPSRVEYVEAGLRKFVDVYQQMGIHSIAFPPLGCGNGQLDFATQVQPLMERYLRNLPIEVFIYPERASQALEHYDQAAMARWLRSEPVNMPFATVWRDLSNLLQTQSSFMTSSRKSHFGAHVSEQPCGITITTPKSTTFLGYETLQAFWQQLRIHGFAMKRFAPGTERGLAYMSAIFTALDYVGQVQIAENYDELREKPHNGLQILPSAFDSYGVNMSGPAQPALF
jgi:O-acetyl-ADP-ribose deacetylase (regulator of RNase III)